MRCKLQRDQYALQVITTWDLRIFDYSKTHHWDGDVRLFFINFCWFLCAVLVNILIYTYQGIVDEFGSGRGFGLVAVRFREVRTLIISTISNMLYSTIYILNVLWNIEAISFYSYSEIYFNMWYCRKFLLRRLLCRSNLHIYLWISHNLSQAHLLHPNLSARSIPLSVSLFRLYRLPLWSSECNLFKTISCIKRKLERHRFIQAAWSLLEI